MAADDAGPVLADIHLTDLPRTAGGVAALVATTKIVARDSGLVRGARALLRVNQKDGFDCPGCAWPEPGQHRSHLEFCENGAKAVAEETTTARATPELFATMSIETLRTYTDFELGQLGRLTHPMRLDAGDTHYRAITWREAFAILAEELHAAGPQRTSFYTSGRTSNEAAYLYQLMARMFGTNNLPDCSNMCHESSGVAMHETLGVGKGTVSLQDFDHAELILVIGQNPGTNHPRMLTTLREAARRDAAIISVNPLREVGLTRFAHPQHPLDVVTGGVALCKEFVQVQLGGDLALLLGVGKAVLESGAIDQAFIDEKTTGFAAWATHVTSLAWPDLVANSGIDEATIRRLAGYYIASRATIVCWAMGLTQQPHAVATIQEVINLLLLRGNFGKPGAGACPVRGHSNVQGDRTMGITHEPTPAFLDGLATEFAFAPPHDRGLDVVETLHAMHRGEVTALVCLGGNFASATPDTEATLTALENSAFTASISTKFNRTHLHGGRRSLVLPCLARSERDQQLSGPQFVTVEDSMSVVHKSQGVLPPASSELRSEPAIVAELGAALFPDRADEWRALAGNYDAIRDHIEHTIGGFERFNERVRENGGAGFTLPNSARDGSFADVGGRAAFTCSPLPDLTIPPGCLRMMTMRSHDQYNTTIYGLDDRYRGIKNERRVVFVHPTDMVVLGLIERQLVDITSTWRGERGDERRTAPSFIVVPFDLPRGACATYFPEANALVPLGSVAARSNTPTSKSVIVKLVPVTPPKI